MSCLRTSAIRDDLLETLRTQGDRTEKILEGDRGSEEEMQTRLSDLKAAINEAKVDWYIVPSEDEHQSEYTGVTEKRREWITNFNGSAGTAIVPASTGSSSSEEDLAILFVDSRYWVIAENQIPKSNWRVERVGANGGSGRGGVVSGWTGWISDHASDGLRIGVDPKLVPLPVVRQLQDSLSGSSTQLVPLDENLVDKVRHPSPRPDGPITPHPLKYAGETSSSKLERMRATLASSSRGHDWIYILPALPSIAWLLNCRCLSDIPDCPVPYAYLALTSEACVLFADEVKIKEEMRAALEESDVAVKPYGVDQVGKYVKEFKQKARLADEKAEIEIWGSAETSWGLSKACGDDIRLIQCPVELAKAIKNPTEQEGFAAAYLRDGRAMVRWFSWLETKLMKEGRELGEWSAGQALIRFRAQEDLYVYANSGISASGPNAALPHYVPERGSDSKIDREAPFLVDSGCQYEDGTIDTTRTVYFGKSPSDEIKRAFTRVLQCHMHVLQAVFPRGTSSAALSMLGRNPMYQEGMDFGHGLGHGVGSFLGVHEYPYLGRDPIEAGHVVTVEPGWYLEGKYGIRTESLVVSVPTDTAFEFGGHRWLAWRRITQVPIQTKLIDWSLLTKDEIRWINEHNFSVEAALLPMLQEDADKDAREWLKRECKPKRIWPWTGA
ncbi:peptidase M24, structural domain-containing protein [Kockovaella imperatae]|uniref:Peptidase M24, structural domain-containing protein n=1 Tax=Kockovaella imperatae TaxID=4999 RepID=A0A1Y1UL66_9TREE|nr:peptidase M24, structural domain-containing protein [Kockovaella imperatae]ORX38297.1 peptidase M24, structural domain-containing protein [Kockovaella imperatae]